MSLKSTGISIYRAPLERKEKKGRQRTTLLNILELSKLGKDNLAKGGLGVVGDTDGADTVVDQDPFVLSGVLLG